METERVSGAVEFTAKLKTNETHLFQSPGMVMLIAAKEMQTHTYREELLGQRVSSRRDEELAGA